eukprot:169908-Pleurochrysis_carterae.AAC.1
MPARLCCVWASTALSIRTRSPRRLKHSCYARFTFLWPQCVVTIVSPPNPRRSFSVLRRGVGAERVATMVQRVGPGRAVSEPSWA